MDIKEYSELKNRIAALERQMKRVEDNFVLTAGGHSPNMTIIHDPRCKHCGFIVDEDEEICDDCIFTGGYDDDDLDYDNNEEDDDCPF